MTTTTTIRIEDDLKARVAAVVQRSGQTAHAFMLDAIAQTAERVELDEAFHRLADERWANVLATGKTVSWMTRKPGLRRDHAGSARASQSPENIGASRPHGPRRTRTGSV